MARKTFEVSEFKNYMNSKLVLDLSDDEKYGLITALEHVLHETGNYKGFGYVYKDDVRPCFPDKVGAQACNPAWDMARDMRRQYY
ncbi:MAG: hypothetical protein EBR82_77580 [Caulobacteraceae bacterium]|nr:hypothetical protein [Caulobacteraceae bacterium]NDG14030.1 hypothetical protein [Betaproteobacteria bacterium]